MPRINTKHAPDFIADLAPFTSNGAITGTAIPGGYLVTSYSTPIALIDTAAKLCHLNIERYSTTTSKHQHAARLAAIDLVTAAGYLIEEYTAAAFEIATGLHARGGRE